MSRHVRTDDPAVGSEEVLRFINDVSVGIHPVDTFFYRPYCSLMSARKPRQRDHCWGSDLLAVPRGAAPRPGVGFGSVISTFLDPDPASDAAFLDPESDADLAGFSTTTASAGSCFFFPPSRPLRPLVSRQVLVCAWCMHLETYILTFSDRYDLREV